MVTDYFSCQKMFYLKYIVKITLTQKKIHLIFGGAFHKVLEYSDKLKPEELHKLFDREFDSKQITKDELNDYLKLQSIGHSMIDNYLKHKDFLIKEHKLNGGDNEFKISSYYFKNPMNEDSLPIPFASRIDKLNQKDHIIWEFKTSKNLWKQDDINYRWQTLLYSMWYYQKYGVLPTTKYIIFRKIEESGAPQVLITKHEVTDLAVGFQELKTMLTKIELGQYENYNKWHPTWCDCIKYEELLDLKIII